MSMILSELGTQIEEKSDSLKHSLQICKDHILQHQAHVAAIHRIEDRLDKMENQLRRLEFLHQRYPEHNPEQDVKTEEQQPPA